MNHLILEQNPQEIEQLRARIAELEDLSRQDQKVIDDLTTGYSELEQANKNLCEYLVEEQNQRVFAQERIKELESLESVGLVVTQMKRIKALEDELHSLKLEYSDMLDRLVQHERKK